MRASQGGGPRRNTQSAQMIEESKPLIRPVPGRPGSTEPSKAQQQQVSQ